MPCLALPWLLLLLQVKDQSYDYTDNASLMQNFRTGTPVRVFRLVKEQPPVYAYEGLYKVVSHKMEKSSDGPKVGAAGCSGPG